MKKIFLLFAFAIAALCTINIEARQTDEFPEEDENQDAARRAMALRLVRIAGRAERLQRATQRRAEARQQMPRPAPEAFEGHAAPAAAAFFESPEAPNAPARHRRVPPRDENQIFQPRDLFQ